MENGTSRNRFVPFSIFFMEVKMAKTKKEVEAIVVSPEGAAEMLGLSRGTIYTLMSSGQLPSLKIGRARRIAVSDIHEYIALCAEDSADA